MRNGRPRAGGARGSEVQSGGSMIESIRKTKFKRLESRETIKIGKIIISDESAFDIIIFVLREGREYLSEYLF